MKKLEQAHNMFALIPLCAIALTIVLLLSGCNVSDAGAAISTAEQQRDDADDRGEAGAAATGADSAYDDADSAYEAGDSVYDDADDAWDDGDSAYDTDDGNSGYDADSGYDD